jgi:hypothetical protein
MRVLSVRLPHYAALLLFAILMPGFQCLAEAQDSVSPANTESSLRLVEEETNFHRSSSEGKSISPLLAQNDNSDDEPGDNATSNALRGISSTVQCQNDCLRELNTCWASCLAISNASEKSRCARECASENGVCKSACY